MSATHLEATPEASGRPTSPSPYILIRVLPMLNIRGAKPICFAVCSHRGGAGLRWSIALDA